jgi:hypothetical protein
VAQNKDELKFNELMDNAEKIEESLHKEKDFLKSFLVHNRRGSKPNRNSLFKVNKHESFKQNLIRPKDDNFK